MTDSGLPTAETDAAERSAPAWLRETLDDLQDLDFEGPLDGAVAADGDRLGDLFRKAAKLHEELGDEAAAPAARVFAMLAAVMGLHFRFTPEILRQRRAATIRCHEHCARV